MTVSTAKWVYKGIANTIIQTIATSTGQTLLGQVAKIGVDSALGSGLKKTRMKRFTKKIKSKI